jgi:hypothetical protein
MAAQVIAFPNQRTIPVCTECVLGEMRSGQLVCQLADDIVTDVVGEAASCPEFARWDGT